MLLLDRGLLTTAWYRRQLARRHPELADALARLDATFEARAELAVDPAGRRRLTVPFLQELVDGERPVVVVDRPGTNLTGGREVVPGVALWHVLPRPEARPEGWVRPAPPDGAARGAWLPATDRDPWTAELRRMVERRNRAN